MSIDNEKTISDYRLSRIEETLDMMAKNLERLTALEQRHLSTREEVDRAFESLGKLADRVRDVELEMPMLKTVKNWVIAAVLGIFAIFAVALTSLVLK